MAGLFITFEGIDGSGKSTHAGQIARDIEEAGREVLLTLEPGGTDLGRSIRDLVLHADAPLPDLTELLLFAADRSIHVEQVIRPALAAGKVVISDRYADSTRAYQGAGRGMDPDLVETAIRVATGGLAPDLTILVDVDVPTSRSRSDGDDRLEKDSDPFYERVRQGFLDLHRAEPDRILCFDGSGPVETVSEGIRRAVFGKLD